MATDVLKDFSHSKNSNSGNLELKNELIIFLFIKVTLKATVVNSDQKSSCLDS